jgi:SNF2 family DNA or RNA helicase
MDVEEQIGKSKQKALKSILDTEIPRGEPCVVFCKFTADLLSVREIAAKLKLRYKELSGAHKEIEKGQYPSNCDIFGVQIQTGGLGINLTTSAYCIFYSIGYSLGEHQQCRDRLHRGGQTRQVLYINLIAKNTIDVTIHDAISQKKEIVDAILEKIRKNID